MRYQNPSAGFTFMIPSAWEGRYEVSERPPRIVSATHPRATAVVTFLYLPAEAGSPRQALLTLVVYERAGWDTVSRGPGPPVGQVVGTTRDRVYVAALPQSNPFDPESQDGKWFAAMQLTLPRVRQAIRLDRASSAAVADSD